MDFSELHPDFQKSVKRTPSFPFGSRRWQPLLQRLINVMPRSPVVDGVSTKDLVVGDVRIRVYEPDADASGAGLMWMHGGGMIVGNQTQDNTTCSTMSCDLGLVVVSVGYRLAPQSPFPAANDDCFAVWDWFTQNARDFGVDPSRIVIAGESGGGGLAAALVHRIHNKHDAQPAAQVLLVPMLDDRTAADSKLDLGYKLWRWSDNRGAWASFLGHEPDQTSEPDYAVPSRRIDLSGLPAAWIGCGDNTRLRWN